MKVMSFKTLLAFGVVTLTPYATHAGTANSHFSVELNKTEVVYLPSNAGAVVIGNPEIADVSVHSANTIFVVGRGYGETNLVVLNAAGHKIMDADIQVVNNLPPHGVRLYNGRERETYNCAPYCQPAPVLGDSPQFLTANQGNAAPIDNNVASGTPSSFAGPSLATSSSGLSGQGPVPAPTQGAPSYGSGS